MTGWRDRALGAAVLGPPLLWAVQLSLAYGAQEGACSSAAHHRGELWGIGSRAGSAWLSVACLAGAVACGIACAVLRPVGSSSEPTGIVDLRRTVRMLGMSGAVLFAALIAFGLVASVVLRSC